MAPASLLSNRCPNRASYRDVRQPKRPAASEVLSGGFIIAFRCLDPDADILRCFTSRVSVSMQMTARVPRC